MAARTYIGSDRPFIPWRKLLFTPSEVPQIRRRLIFFDRHRIAVSAHIIVFLADVDVSVVLGTDLLGPPGRPGLLVARVILDNRPRTRIGVIDQRDLIMQDVRLGL